MRRCKKLQKKTVNNDGVKINLTDFSGDFVVLIIVHLIL